MAESKLITLPITGMTCANCVATVERNIKKVNGVQSAVVNLSTERATVEFDPALADLSAMLGRVSAAGYGIATGKADLTIRGMNDDNDGRRLEKSLRVIEGITEVNVNHVNGKVLITYIPTILSQLDIRKSIRSSGFEALESGAEAEDAEALARQHEIDGQNGSSSLD